MHAGWKKLKGRTQGLERIEGYLPSWMEIEI